jgi:hypothetical protein
MMAGRGRWFVMLLLAVGLGACAQKEPSPEHPAHAVATPPPANSPLAKVQVGMSPREVENILGPPNDENQYMTGKAFIPFFYGRDRWRRAYFYKGMGRVVFGGSGGFSQSAHVTRVEYDPNEPGRAR